MATRDQIVTLADFEAFKKELVGILTQTLNTGSRPVKKWLKSSEVRKLIGVSAGKLLTIRNTGLLTFTKIGGNIYYDQDELLQLFEGNKRRIK